MAELTTSRRNSLSSMVFGLPGQYPADHKVGMEVPEGGSDCGKCEYVSEDEKKCTNTNFIAWNGSEFLPKAATRYCCDFFETGD